MSIRDLVRRTPMFDEWLTTWPSMTSWGQFMPNLEVSDNDKFVDVSAELPGMTNEDIEVTLSADHTALILKGEKKFEEEKKEDNFHRMERRYGSFMRTVALPTAVDPKGVEATFTDGILRVHMPKAPAGAAAGRRIAVKKA